MHYYKSQELADLYNISRRTVTNWIKQTQEGRLDLELIPYEGSSYIAKTLANQIKINFLVKERRKYLNTRSRTYIEPTKDFYETYTEKQIQDIIHNLTVNKEIPLQYSYFGEGAEVWDKFRSRVGGTFDPESLTPAVISYLDVALEDYEKVNLVDVGVGNGMGARPLLTYLKSRNKLNRYIGFDLSPDMLDKTRNNINQWFQKDIKVETYIKDVAYEPFEDIIAEPIDQKTGKQKVINLVLLFGGSISNFKSPSDVLRTINRSMNLNDLFICSFRLGIPQVKNELGFITFYQRQYELVLKNLGITENYYKTEIGFDEKSQIRYGRIRLKKSIQLKFNLSKGEWYVDLNKDDTILIYRAHFNNPFTTPYDLFYKNGFNPVLTAQLPWHTSMLLLADLNMNKE